VGFLHGSRAILEAAEAVKQAIAPFEELKARVDVLPLYRDVSPEIQERVLAVKQPGDPTIRVIISSNMAETSLTISGLVHVVDSGLIKMTEYDWLTGKSTLLPYTHSQAAADNAGPGGAHPTGPGLVSLHGGTIQ